MRILIAEDDDSLRALVSEVLAEAGHTPLAECNGELAWKRLQRDGADMLITDINMPELDGIQLLCRIRRSKDYKKIPVMMLTIRALAEDQVLGYDAGADDYLAKPFDNAILVARVNVLERRILKHNTGNT